MDLYPLTFEPILKEKVWGGRHLASFGKPLPEGVVIGESWELADLAQTSAGGGGGGAARSIVANGPLAGQTLREAMDLWGAALLGGKTATQHETATQKNPRSGFPLLLKLLDAAEHLSVQTHPSVAYAESHPGAHLKSEAWFVIHAEVGTVIYAGLRKGETASTLRDRVAAGTVAEGLRELPVREGDWIHLPSGVPHALGAGVVVAEVQTPSDTTFRLDDWGRTGRELHIEQALECVETLRPHETTPALRRIDEGDEKVLETPHFTVRRRDASGEIDMPSASESSEANGGPVAIMWLRGEGSIEGEGFDAVPMRAGSTVLLPAALRGVQCVVQSDDALAIEVLVPAATLNTTISQRCKDGP